MMWVHVRRRPWSFALLLVVATTVVVTLACLVFPWWRVAPSSPALTRSIASHITPSSDEKCFHETYGHYECGMQTLGNYDSVASPFYYRVRVGRNGCWDATLERNRFGNIPTSAPHRIHDCVRAWHYLD